MQRRFVTVEGNEAVANVAYQCNEVIAIYPITPASPMGEMSDTWAASGRENIFGTVPEVIEMQSEAGAAGTVHGALQTGSLTTAIRSNPQDTEDQIQEQRRRVAALKDRVKGLDTPEAGQLLAVADALVRRSVWIVGGDGWAYDIGFGGLDHVLASGRDVNILVLDTEVYSNTGGHASKSTPRAAVAKFASQGKAIGKKDLGMIAVDYGNVYVAQVAMGANPLQTLRAFQDAESYRGPSLILAYSHCIAQGLEMSTAMSHQKEATASGYWPLYRYDPRLAGEGKHPFHLDSRKPTLPLKEFTMQEARYAMLARANPAQAERLVRLAQRDVNERWRFYEQMAGVERGVPERMEEGEEVQA